MSFRIGQKVVCVDGRKTNHPTNEIFPKEGEIYTIREFYELDFVCIRLVEIVNEPKQYSDGFVECSFALHRFRPLIERSTETGMAILRKVADDAAKRKNLVVNA